MSKKNISLFIIALTFQASNHCVNLELPPATITPIKEIAIIYNQHLAEYFNQLTPQERIFIYYIFRASLPGNVMAADQSHRHALPIRHMLEYILDRKDKLETVDFSSDAEEFIKQVTTYLVYLWTNHSQYFLREHRDEKRTPERLHLDLLNKENLIEALSLLDFPDAKKVVEEIVPSLFDYSIEPSQTIPNSIEKSAVNFYSADFTEDDFKNIESAAQSMLNAYFYIDCHNGMRIPQYQRYSIHEKYGKELSVAVHWLQKAYEHARQYPQQFDEHLVMSLAYLIEYFITGDEQLFKKHSVEWLQSNGRIDYCFGFIETYSDPKSYRAIFQSDVTIKAMDMAKINKVLPKLEDQLPFSAEFKRENLDTDAPILNASINVKAFSSGSLGPLNVVLAYCLPNYEEIRAEHGSKQIIYHAEKSLGELINPDIYYRLFNATPHYQWAKQYDSNFELDRDLLMLHVILHETLGHGSGKLATHTFQEGDPLTIEGKTYKIGNIIPVTSNNIQQFLAGYDHAIEELRAEIIALLSSIISFDELVAIGLYKDWPDKISKTKLLEMAIISMCRFGLYRLRNLADDSTEVAGDHAKANTTLNNYLIDHGGIEIVEEPITIEDKEWVIIDVMVNDLDKTIHAIEELAQLVQEIKSTGNGQKAQWLIETYGTKIRNQGHLRHLKQNQKAAAGEVKVLAALYPYYHPLMNNGSIIDIETEWPASIIEQYNVYRGLAYNME